MDEKRTKKWMKKGQKEWMKKSMEKGDWKRGRQGGLDQPRCWVMKKMDEWCEIQSATTSCAFKHASTKAGRVD